MHLRKVLTALVLLMVGSGLLMAQNNGTTPPQVKVPWNNYLPQRIANNYQTIIGAAGTIIVPNTQYMYGGSQTYNFDITANNGGNVGFPFFFLNNYYSVVQVDVAGYIGFNQANYAGYGWGYGSA